MSMAWMIRSRVHRYEWDHVIRKFPIRRMVSTVFPNLRYSRTFRVKDNAHRMGLFKVYCKLTNKFSDSIRSTGRIIRPLATHDSSLFWSSLR